MLQTPNRRIIIGSALFALSSCATIKNNSIIELQKSPKLSIADDLDSQINNALSKLKAIAGLGVSVYTPNGVYLKTFGVCDIETQEKVSKDTVFYIASSTKSMVALALANLHEKGQINLDITLSGFAPVAKFPTQTRPNEVKLRDLLSQSSGITNSLIEFRQAYSGQFDDNLLWNLLSKSQVNTKKELGKFKYTNSNYNILTLLVEKKLGKNWKQILQTEIFDKAQMTRTSAYISRAEKQKWSIAKPHLNLGANVPKKSYLQKTDETMHSAGGVFMSSSDALKWLELLVENGRINGKQIVSSAAINAVKTPHVEVNESFGKYKRDHYGLGFYIGNYGDTDNQLIHHFGSFSGSRSHVSFMPNKKIGIAVFVNDNQAGFQLVDLIANYIYDTLIGNTNAHQDFENNIDKLVKQYDAQQAKILLRETEALSLKWSLNKNLNDYAGIYENEEYGIFEVKPNGKTLQIKMGNLHGIAMPNSEAESVRVELIPGSGEIISFNSNTQNMVESLSYANDIYIKK